MKLLSRNRKGRDRMSHGLTLDDVRGLIHKPVSHWAIDESGNPSRKLSENGKAFTLSAVTELSPIDYDRLLEGVPLYDGEVHFSKLRHEHPDICIQLMTDLGREDILSVSLTVMKRSKNVSLNRSVPRDELYLFSLLNELISAVNEVDDSDLIVIRYDRNDQIRGEMCEMLWSPHCIIMMDDSAASKLIQVADLCASSIGRSLLPEPFGESSYRDKIEDKTVWIRERLGGSTQLPPSASSNICAEEVFKGAGELTQRPPSAPLDVYDGPGYKTIPQRTKRLNNIKKKNEGRLQLSPAFLPYNVTEHGLFIDSNGVAYNPENRGFGQ